MKRFWGRAWTVAIAATTSVALVSGPAAADHPKTSTLSTMVETYFVECTVRVCDDTHVNVVTGPDFAGWLFAYTPATGWWSVGHPQGGDGIFGRVNPGSGCDYLVIEGGNGKYADAAGRGRFCRTAFVAGTFSLTFT